MLAHDLTGKKDKIVHHNRGKYAIACTAKGNTKGIVFNRYLSGEKMLGCFCPKPVPDDIENLNKDMFNAFAGFFR